MSGHLPYSPEEHKIRVMCGDPVALAYEWIDAYTKNLNTRGADDGDDEYYYSKLTIEELIETAIERIEDPESWAYINKGPLFDGVYVDDTFWDKLAILKQIDIPKEKRNNFFSCSC